MSFPGPESESDHPSSSVDVSMGKVNQKVAPCGIDCNHIFEGQGDLKVAFVVFPRACGLIRNKRMTFESPCGVSVMKCPRENIKKADTIYAGLFYETVPA